MRLPQDRILHIDTELAGDEVRVVMGWQGEIVRCKDCKYYKKITEKSDHGLCHRDIVASVWGENGYCSRAKMKGGE